MRRCSLRICVVESLASARRSNALPTQGAQLADFLERDGHTVIRTSYRGHPLVRAVDMAQFLINRRHGYDVVLLQMFGHRAFSFARVVSLISCRLGKRLVIVLADADLARLWNQRRETVAAVLNRADVVVAPTQWLKKMLEPRYAPVVVPNVIDVKRYPFVLRRRVEPRLLWARGYHAQYDPLLAVDVVREIRRTYSHVHLTMLGPDQGLRASCESRIERLGLSPNVVVRGVLQKADLIRESARHEIHLHTNLVDNMPVTFLEQMALGLPIVASAIGGIPSFVVDRETALLVWERAPAAYAEAVESLVRDPELSARLSRSGRAFVERECTWRSNRRRWVEILAG